MEVGDYVVKKSGDQFFCREVGPVGMVGNLNKMSDNELYSFVDCGIHQVVVLSEEIRKATYREIQNNSGLAVGDKVRVTRKANKFEHGWPSAWVDFGGDDMGEIIGETVEVSEIGDAGVRFKGEKYFYPCFVLEKVYNTTQVSNQEESNTEETPKSKISPSQKAIIDFIRHFPKNDWTTEEVVRVLEHIVEQ